MDTALWAVQGILAFMFLMAGLMKSTQPIPKLAEKMGWVNDVPASRVRLAGGAEVLGALGLVLPMALDILPVLTPIAAIGLAFIMILAIPVHKRRGETQMIGGNIMFFALAAFVAAGRLIPLT